MHLDGFGELHHPGGQRNVGTAAPGGEPGPVPPFEGALDSVAYARVETDVLGQQPRRQAVGVDQRRHPPAWRDHEGEQQTYPLGRRPVGTGTTKQIQQIGQAGPVEVIAVASHREVIAEPTAELVGVGMTPDPEHQIGVVDTRTLLDIQLESVGEERRDPRGAQHVLRGQSQTQVDRDRQCREDLGPAWPTRLARSALREHGRSLTRPLKRLAPGTVSRPGELVRKRRLVDDDQRGHGTGQAYVEAP